MIARLVYSALLEYESQGPIRKALRRAMRAPAKFTTTVSGDASVGFGFGIEPERGIADSGNLEDDLIVLIAALGRAAGEAETGVIFLLDELQLLGRSEIEGLVAALHGAGQQQLPVALVGAGLPTLPRLILDAKTYAERPFDLASGSSTMTLDDTRCHSPEVVSLVHEHARCARTARTRA